MKFKRIKLKLLTLSIVALILTFVTQGSLAYYTVLGRATNVITSGELKMEIHETTEAGTEFPKEGIFVMPGMVFGKRVTVQNICTQPFYLRAKIVYGIDSQTLPVDDCIELVGVNNEYWKLVDGWFYYYKALEPGDTTEYIFSDVEIVGAKVDSSYIGKTLTLTVDAQAVQSKNNPVNGTNTHEAFGWPIG